MTTIKQALGLPEVSDRLQAKHKAAVNTLAAARAALGDAALMAELNGEGDTAKERQAVIKAESALAELAATIAAAERQTEQHRVAIAAAEVTRRWDEASHHATQRGLLATEADNLVAALAGVWQRLLAENEAIVRAAPVKLDQGGSKTWRDDVEGAFRIGLVRSGFPWAATWPWGVDAAPAFADVVRKANEYIAESRRKSEAH